MTGTSVLVALDGLVDFWTVVAPDGWDVLDAGPPIDPDRDWLCVGFDESEDPAVSVSEEIADAQMGSDLETFDVSSLMSRWLGNADARTARTDVVGAFSVFRDALRLDPTVGGRVARARITDWDLMQGVSALGNYAAIRFTTRVSTWK
jgi:hypothetical protein